MLSNSMCLEGRETRAKRETLKTTLNSTLISKCRLTRMGTEHMFNQHEIQELVDLVVVLAIVAMTWLVGHHGNLHNSI